jgi:hypothetical protein
MRRLLLRRQTHRVLQLLRRLIGTTAQTMIGVRGMSGTMVMRIAEAWNAIVTMSAVGTVVTDTGT